MKLLPTFRKVRSLVGFVGLVTLGAAAIFTGIFFPRGQFGDGGGTFGLSDSNIAHADAPTCGTCDTGCGDGCGGDGCGDCSGDYE